MKNLILRTDSYKASHSKLYPPGTENLYSYLESRGGKYGETVFFGLQYLIKEYLAGEVLTLDMVDGSELFFAAHGEPFDTAAWRRLVAKHNGTLPIRIKAVPEGTVVPTHNVLMTVEATDPEFYWLPSYLETMFVRGVWYPTTVATQSYYIKRLIRQYLEETADAPAAELPFNLHDFGARGVSSAESAGIGGAAHLVNFMGSDTVEGIWTAHNYYGCKTGMPGFSIPATEHSTIISWGKDREVEAYQNVVKQFAKPGALFACVSDSYDLWNVLENVWGGCLRDEIEKSGATLVVRPDSGNPADVVLKTLQTLERKVGAPLNMRGFKLLPKWIRVIQGDGINQDSIEEILSRMKAHGYSASNVAFGMGGALLQQVNRDTQRFAYKVSEATLNGVAVPVCKDPITDPGKRSKSGRFALVKQGGKFATVPAPARGDLLETVFENGRLLRDQTFDDVRSRAV
jgi:nicotinamide phosphoribosyltransferase